ncbi:Uncharacterized protein TPAR_06170 [Tolypocladium paradoxum]|uniref:Uncharacterized protein n=1 Tax=Tolypocladium paradoxum TaxID=94208 RepID=A0A2S4KTW6_9HYPO|nr:Uncharacterized protein TPAR_06170 [Tolypocladium paradoxum]
MFAPRGRGGPSRSTPANVQCQKCLKRDMDTATRTLYSRLTLPARHYSYECKSSTQERPYVSRPSRSQQLRNPKLVPKLTNNVLEPEERKKGVADEEIAKRETERAKKRELDDHDDEMIKSSSKRRRSASTGSISTMSTNASRNSRPPRSRKRSATPPRRRRSPESVSGDERRPRGRRYSRSYSRSYSSSSSPPRRRQRSLPRDSRSPSPPRRYTRSLSPDSRSPSPPPRRQQRPLSRDSRSPSPPGRQQRSLSRDSRSPSPPPRRKQRSTSHDSRSPPPERHERSYRVRDDRPPQHQDDENYPKRPRRDSFKSGDSRGSYSRRQDYSRSPEPQSRWQGERQYRAPRGGRAGGARDDNKGHWKRQADEPPRERSLSPFSRRLALTREMNDGGR